MRKIVGEELRALGMNWRGWSRIFGWELVFVGVRNIPKGLEWVPNIIKQASLYEQTLADELRRLAARITYQHFI